MPIAGDGTYSLPAGYKAVTGEPAEAAQHNEPLEDIEAVLNQPRPITKGGTGASTEAGARANLGVSAAPFLNGRNYIINGAARVNQRTYVSGTPTTSANQYTFDRWRVVVLGQSIVWTGNEARRVMTAPLGGIEQVIEGASIGAGTYVINWTGTASCTVNGVSRAKGATFTLPSGIPATVRFTNGTVTDAQLELGEFPTPFEYLPFGTELHNCCRYFQRFDYRQRWDAATGLAADTRILPFPVVMRDTPAATLTTATNINNSSFSVTGASLRSFQFTQASAAAGVVDWSGVLIFDAEI